MRKLLMTAATAAMLAGGTAQAATTGTSFVVSATVLATCSATANPLAFPNYTPGGGSIPGSTTVNVKCTKSTPFTVSLNAGSTTGGTFAQRLMAGSSNTLQYNLYTTAGLTTIFGDGSPGTGTTPGTGAGVGTAVAVSVYGQVPDTGTNPNAAPGAYSDTINVTVTY